MNICIPIDSDQGEESPLCAHFGSAFGFMLIDTETGVMRAKHNDNEHHAHGQCRPLEAIAGEQVDTMIVGGIGRGAFLGLSQTGIQVLLSRHRTVKEALKALEDGELSTVDPSALCAGHGHGEGQRQGNGPGQGQGGGGCGHRQGSPQSPF